MLFLLNGQDLQTLVRHPARYADDAAGPLKDHNGQQLEAEVVATFLPSEVVESLYTVIA